MAKSGKKKAPAKKKQTPARTAPRLTARHWRIIRNVTGILLALLAIYTLGAIVSYIFTWSSDQSLVSQAAEGVAKNSGGRFGFRWAKLLVTDMFGIGAFAIVAIFGAAALRCLKRKVRFFRILFVAFFGAVLLSLISSAIAGFFGNQTIFGQGIGGAYGTAMIHEMNTLMGPVGTVAVIVAAVVLFLVFSSSKFATWISSLGEKQGNARTKDIEDGKALPANPEADSSDGDDSADVDGMPDEDDEDDGEDNRCDDGRANEEVEQRQDAPDCEDGDDGIGDSLDLKEQEDDEDRDRGLDGGDEGIVKVEEINIQTGDNVPEGSVSERYDPRLDLPDYKFPGLELLDDYSDQWYDIPPSELQRNNMKITAALAEYKIQIQSISARKGPTVTLYEIVPAPGTKIAQIKRVEEDIARSIGVTGVRVVTLLNTIGIEVPNDKPSIVPMKSLLNDPEFRNNHYELPVAMGYTISQKVLAFDLAKTPHLLVAGTTGTGKSVGLNVILTSLLYSKHPSELKLVLIDPKRVELSIYDRIKNHFLASVPDEQKPIITDTSNVVKTLKSLCTEMESRYELLEKARERNIKDYNERFLDRRLNPNNGHKFLPYIVVVIDEFADFLYTAGKEVEEPISRLAAKARAVGIHLIIATQRPSADVVTGIIKANFPSRIAFKVSSSSNSMIVLDETGANKLIGRGDMLVMLPGKDICRAQCAFVDTVELERVVNFIGDQRGYLSQYYLPECEDEADTVEAVDLGKRDVLFDEAARIIVASQQGSTSLLQRKMEIGYARAGRIMDQLEAAGIVGPSEGSKARKVMVMDFDQLDDLLRSLN